MKTYVKDKSACNTIRAKKTNHKNIKLKTKTQSKPDMIKDSVSSSETRRKYEFVISEQSCRSKGTITFKSATLSQTTHKTTSTGLNLSVKYPLCACKQR